MELDFQSTPFQKPPAQDLNPKFILNPQVRWFCDFLQTSNAYNTFSDERVVKPSFLVRDYAVGYVSLVLFSSFNSHT
uniref:Uncharacterized protein n=1 Tax=Tetranychus urticae TaxID=32264 RepID=T1KPQ6_TETUR